MQTDAIATALRRDAELLLAQAPPPHPAPTWHRMRAARAAKVQRMLNRCAWGLHLGPVALLAGALAIAPLTALTLLPALILVGWLATGIATTAGSSV